LSKVVFDGILLDKCKFIDCQLKTTKFIDGCYFINMDSTNFGINEIKFREGFVRWVIWRCIQPVTGGLKPNSLTNMQSDWDNELDKHQLHSVGGWAIEMHPQGYKIVNKTNRFIASYLLLGNDLAQLSFNSNELEVVNILKRYV
jgi:hypothetical protein